MHKEPDHKADTEAAQEAAKQLPDIRQEKVQDIQDALAAGQYHVSSEDLADHLIQDVISNTPDE